MTNVDPKVVPAGMETDAHVQRGTLIDITDLMQSQQTYPGWVKLLLGAIVGSLISLGASHFAPGGAAKAAISSESPLQKSPGVSPLVFSGTGSVADAFEWAPPADCPFIVFGKQGQCIALVLPPKGEFPLGLTVRSASGGRLTSHTASMKVSAEGLVIPVPPLPTPGPAPGPSPTPPAPPVPDGKYKLGAWIKAEVEKSLASRGSRVEESKALSATFDSLASKISAGGLGGIGSIVSETYSSIDATLGPAREAWEPVVQAFETKIVTTVSRTASDQDIADAWREISIGLGAVR